MLKCQTGLSDNEYSYFLHITLILDAGSYFIHQVTLHLKLDGNGKGFEILLVQSTFLSDLNTVQSDSNK